MKRLLLFFLLLPSLLLNAQDFKVDTAFIQNNFPKELVSKFNVVYKTVNGMDLKLDYYRLTTKVKSPLIISIHGGAWLSGSKNDDIHYSTRLFNRLLQAGYAVVCIDYRLSQTATFPAQIQDCNDAIDYIYKNNDRLLIDKNKIAVMGGSAGGHLAELLGTSNEHNIPDFYTNKKKPDFNIKAVVTSFGVSDLIACRGNSGWIDHDDPNSAEAKLLGASPLDRPDLAKKASPTTYITGNTPPFLIFHGDKDPVVQYSQSVLLHSYLNLAGVKNKFITVKGAGHGGAEFGALEYEDETVNFLNHTFGKQ